MAVALFYIFHKHSPFWLLLANNRGNILQHQYTLICLLTGNENTIVIRMRNTLTEKRGI